MLTLYRPTRSIAQRHRSLFDDFFEDFSGWPWQGELESAHGSTPAVDLREEEGAYVLQADLPGFEEKDVGVSLESDVLTINAEHESSKDETRDGFKLRERYHGSYSRSFRLGKQINRDGIEATYRNGVLKVVLPKSAEAAPQQIPISVN